VNGPPGRLGRRRSAAAELGHLARRFAGSISRRPPPPGDEAWVRTHLLDGEHRLWCRMSAADRRHAVGVARRVVALLGDAATRPVMAAALLHDVGKVDSGLGTLGRVAATVVDRRRGDGRFARYRRHDAIGAALLRDAGSAELTWRWAEEHHRPPLSWTVAPELAQALKAADDD
jgi:hypothetical protein